MRVDHKGDTLGAQCLQVLEMGDSSHHPGLAFVSCLFPMTALPDQRDSTTRTLCRVYGRTMCLPPQLSSISVKHTPLPSSQVIPCKAATVHHGHLHRGKHSSPCSHHHPPAPPVARSLPPWGTLNAQFSTWEEEATFEFLDELFNEDFFVAS